VLNDDEGAPKAPDISEAIWAELLSVPAAVTPVKLDPSPVNDPVNEPVKLPSPPIAKDAEVADNTVPSTLAPSI
jgi:hypothetical protein